jgi:hypothetical protein
MKLLLFLSILVLLSGLANFNRYHRTRGFIDPTYVEVRYQTDHSSKFQQPTRVTTKEDGTVKILLQNGKEYACIYNVNKGTLECNKIDAGL